MSQQVTHLYRAIEIVSLILMEDCFSVDFLVY